MALSPTLPHQLLCDELTARRLGHVRKPRALLPHRAGDGWHGRSRRPLAQGRSLVPAAVAMWRTTLRSRHQKRRRSRCAARCSPSNSGESDKADEEAIATGVPRLPLDTWLEQVKLHQDLAKDIEEKFGSVPQQANEVVQDVVMRIQEGAQQCVAPAATAHPFGSTVNGFGEESSDLDVLVAIDEEELTYYMSYASFQSRYERLGSPLLSEGALSDFVQPSLLLKAVTPKMAMTHAVQQLADFLPELGFKVSQLIPRARKPLVTLEDTKSTLTEVDVSINNSLPLYNSQLLRAYSELDPRVRPLVLLVKVWAKGKKVCGAQGGNLSSYSWTIMVLYFLQLVGLLPSLQLLSKDERMLETRDYWGNERSFQVGFLTAEEYQKGVKNGKFAAPAGEAGLSLAELFYGFIHFYSKEYKWGSEVVSVQKPDRKDRGPWFLLFGKAQPEPCIHVEDPIEFRDLNIVMLRERLAQLKEEFEHALEILAEGGSLQELLNREPRPEVMLVPRRRKLGRRKYKKSIPLPRLLLESLLQRFSCWIAAVRTHYLVLLFFTLVVYFPRLCLSYAVFFLAQLLRLIARLTGVATGRPVANRRILVITDYLPPQTHGIAIRCHAYIKEMRAKGHEVIVFSTAYEANKETSFDHPNIPAVVNPFNMKNRIGYTPGVKLAWFLGAHTWDVVHLVYPSLIGTFVLSTCAWRRIPVYCSHHVEMNMFAYKLVPIRPVAEFGLRMYDMLGLWPAIKWGTLNSAPTLCFARDHLGKEHEAKLRRVPSGTHSTFTPTPASSTERRDVRLAKFGVDNEEEKVLLMVQRLSAEKGTERVFQALVPKEEGGQGVKGVLAIAGDGPSKDFLVQEATRLRLRVVFLGNVPHQELPQLYRSADCFVTMSLSETFGLTCLEAMMCGCPAVMPCCSVFDEIWLDKDKPLTPKEWHYNIESTEEFAAAMARAQASGRKYLQEHPVRMTWKDAAENLLEQYEECIKMNQKKRETLRELVLFLDHCVRVAVCSLAASWVLCRYYWPVVKGFGRQLGLEEFMR
ncbi:Tent2 [Symbiodinium sp. CCMP2456]|nr:Tent2 [Symbiodinium sp. CCMP2456]